MVSAEIPGTVINLYCNNSSNLCKEAQCQAFGLSGLLPTQGPVVSILESSKTWGGRGSGSECSVEVNRLFDLRNWKPWKVSLKPGNLEREAREREPGSD